MVDPVGVEVLLHVMEPPAPPPAPVLVHLIPVVGGEAPVLLRVARGASVAVQLEQVRLGPHVLGAARDADGEIALECHALALEVPRSLDELDVKVVLREVHTHHLIVVAALEGRDDRGILHTLRPLRAVEPLVVEGALLGELDLEGRVRHQPLRVVLHIRVEVGVLEDLVSPDRIEERIHELPLLVKDPPVVDLPVAVELVDKRLCPPLRAREVHPKLLGVVIADGDRANIDRVQRER
mmetsp:Transcript_64541/g.153950  ORF Transcript_64541/g.153950 Transcript_64541/m.153950 type:complete len:238 (-) Transcript_64541:1206-1919(-)